MAYQTPTLVPTQVRMRLAHDPALGGGNFLHHALKVSPDPNSPYLTSERAIGYIDNQPKDQFSLNEIDLLARSWSAHYTDRGVRLRDRVAVYLHDSFEDLIHFFALCQIGAIPVLINGRMEPRVALDHCRRTGAIGLHTDDEHLQKLGDLSTKVPSLRWTQTDAAVSLVGRGAMASESTYRHADQDPILICHSSGTTGVPKPVIWAHAQSMVGVRCHLVSFRDQRDSVILSALPPSHAATIGYAALAMLTGIPLVILADSSGSNVATAIDHYQATTVAAFAHTYSELAALHPQPGQFKTVESWVSVGDSAHKAHISRLVRTGRHWEAGKPMPGSMFIDSLGASELGWGGVLSRITVPGTEHDDRCIGTPQPHAVVRILRPDGTEANNGEIGLLAVKSEAITPGYWNDSDATYCNQLSGYWLSGDLAHTDQHGRFYHVDRAIDAIPVGNGIGYSVLMEEMLLSGLPEIHDCVVVAGSINGETRPIALVMLHDHCTSDTADLLHKANTILRNNNKPELAHLDITEPGTSMPLGPTGKVLKRQLREKFNLAN
jgi:acyl-coenzyme A synthetase/AMP-(fatty) acid ligase